MQKENANVVNDNTGQATPERENTAWKNETRLVTRQAKPDLHITTARGFTLIELLVVVLIIGILAAVAVPQYQKAVEKSRATQALTLLKSVAQAGEAYHMANGTYATKFDELAVEIPWTGTTKGYPDYQATDTLSDKDWSIQLYNDTMVQNCIYLTRLTGKYKGSLFTWCWTNNLLPLNQILCVERKSGGVIFSGQEGDYCQKVMRGQRSNASNQYATVFEIPF